MHTIRVESDMVVSVDLCDVLLHVSSRILCQPYSLVDISDIFQDINTVYNVHCRNVWRNRRCMGRHCMDGQYFDDFIRNSRILPLSCIVEQKSGINLINLILLNLIVIQ
jgi:hypothetical protein